MKDNWNVDFGRPYPNETSQRETNVNNWNDVVSEQIKQAIDRRDYAWVKFLSNQYLSH